MKKPSFINKMNNSHYLLVWICFHIGVLLFLGITWFVSKGNLEIDADLMNMFPKSFQEESIRKADEKLTEITGQNVFVLVANKDFNSAKNTAVKVYNELKESDNFKSLNLYSEFGEMDDITDLLFKYRFNLLDDASIDQINSPGGAEAFAQNALMQAYSPFTLLSLDNLDVDPFMLSETIANNYLDAVGKSGIAMSVKDGVMAAQGEDGTWYVMLRGILTAKGAALASKDNGVAEIYSVCNKMEAEGKTEGSRFVYSGSPFNSHQSSNSAMKEITRISTITLLLVIIMLLIVFRSPLPIICSVCSIVVSIITAFCATIAVFHKMHILTMVFGTSLIGSCIDYSLHYFTHWAGNQELKSGNEIRKHMLTGSTMAIMSSVLCYIILLFAPFNLLKQMSVFSISGLISSFLTTLAIYPFISLPKRERTIPMLKIIRETEHKHAKKMIGRVAITVMFVFSIGTILICNNRISIQNDLHKLYTMKGKLLEDRTETVSIIKYNPTGWFIIRGETENEALKLEEQLSKRIDEATDGQMGYISTSKFIPSQDHQQRSREACKKLLSLASAQYEALGFEEDLTDLLKQEMELTEGDYISLSNGDVPEFITSLISTAWLGEMNGKYYTVVMPNIINDNALMNELTEGNKDIFFISKLAEMGSDLDKLTRMVLIFFVFAYLVMFGILKIFYSLKQASKIISVPLLIVLMTVAVYAIADIRLEFFSVVGLILVFGLGLDYIIYMMENEKPRTLDSRTLDPFATLLSFITTVISFGALALSSFQPVHLMGLSIFLGLTTAYISTMFYDRSL